GGGLGPHVEGLAGVAVDEAQVGAVVEDLPVLVGAAVVGPLDDVGAVGPARVAQVEDRVRMAHLDLEVAAARVDEAELLVGRVGAVPLHQHRAVRGRAALDVEE
ncbi:hypothetical protein ADL26_20705, partial [Thermoactinomyces vulgaris]